MQNTPQIGDFNALQTDIMNEYRKDLHCLKIINSSLRNVKISVSTTRMKRSNHDVNSTGL
jgi:hypothetical protein